MTKKGILFAGLSLGCAGLFISLGAAAAPVVLDRVVAVVGDEAVLQSDILRFKAELESSPALAQIYRIDPDKISFESVQALLIDERVIKYAVKESGTTVADSEIDSQISSIAKQNNISREQLEQSLARENIPLDLYRRNIRSQIERRNIFDRELRKGGGVSESEIRSLYDEKVGLEYKISVIAMKPSAANKKTLEALGAGVMAGKVKASDAVEKHAGEDLGWVGADSLDPKIASVVAEKVRASNGGLSVAGPVEIGGTLQLLLVEASRKGSEEGFQKAKAELSQAAQNLDYERRFGAWLERKRSEMQIVINK